MIFNGGNQPVPLEDAGSLLSFRFKVTKKLFDNKREGYYVFKGIDLLNDEDEDEKDFYSSPFITPFSFNNNDTDASSSSSSSSSTYSNVIIIFLQFLRKVEMNPRSSLPLYCEYHQVDFRDDFIYRGKSDSFYYICVLKYSDDILKYI